MGSDFPKSHILGIDISPVQPGTVKPKNVDFTIGDVTNLPLPYADGSFDYVHIRLLFLALKAEFWPVLIKELVRIVRPGGYLEMMEAENICMEGGISTGVPNLGTIMVAGLKARGVDIHVAQKLKGYLSAQPDLTDIHQKTETLSMAPHPSDVDGMKLAKMMNDDGAAAMGGLKGAFLAKGVCKEEDWDYVLSENLKEMRRRGHKVYWTRCWGRKRSSEE
ncbi:hypothetical protein HK097_000248 [Rhizophlyctis rosea]|uniref:Methyltransferase domain-containing protein n=1 Tax=Rhizophlyctis rosea TaxID=64517 RepID=A0AAD5X3Q1_9FUNG|nr:hypothetical protein HK097_000248 [Rhizophlyctis rosea]